MQFYEYRTTRDLIGKHSAQGHDSNAFYKSKFTLAIDTLKDKCSALQMLSEGLWEKEKRPYYNVYPAISPMLLSLALEIDTSFVKPPIPCFCVRFPTERTPISFDWGGKTWRVQTILAGPAILRNVGKVYDGLLLWVDIGERRRMPDGNDYPIYTYINLPLESGLTLEQALTALPYDPSAFKDVVMPPEVRTACARMVCTICLLQNDHSIIAPDVLSKDRADYERTQDPKYVERAIRRGKVGFNIGEGIEVIPHVRRPHPALMWTGHGRTVPKIVLRKGSVVHREIVERAPTGYHGND